jgi:hypothetical protein
MESVNYSFTRLLRHVQRCVIPAVLLLTTHAIAGITIDGRDPAEYFLDQPGKAWAVVIGIDSYQYAQRLKYAVTDAKAVARLLDDQGFQTTTLYDGQATRRAIVSELGGKLLKKVTPQDRVLIYYAGHGVEQRVEGGKVMGYLLPVDGEVDDFSGTGVSMGLLKELADALPTKHVLFIVDSCYGGIAGQLFRSAAPSKATADYIRLITRERGRQIITAGGADQEALEAPEWGHSVFTYYLLNGIGQGLADLNNDGIIPASELYTYLDSRVYAAAQMKGHTQRPELWSLAAEKGEFVFVPRSTLPRGASPPAPETNAFRDRTNPPGPAKEQIGAGKGTQSVATQYAVASDSSDVQILDRDPNKGCTWVSSMARVPFGEHVTKHQAQAQAISEARSKAMRSYLGIKVQPSFVDFMQERDLKGQGALIEPLLKMTQEGHILKEQVLSSRINDVTGCGNCEFEVKVKDCILPLADQSDRDFRVSLALNRSTFVDGDEGILYVSASREAYVHLYSIDMNQNAVLLFPNSYAKENLVHAEQQFIFPSEDLRRKGLRLRARLPEKASTGAEMIRVIATKTPLPLSISDPSQEGLIHTDVSEAGAGQDKGSLFNLYAKLHRAKVSWVEDGQAFTIHEK